MLGGKPFPDAVQPLARGAMHGGNRFALLVVVVVAGVVLQVVNQLVSAYGTQVQVDTGQRMVYDLRYRLFAHLQALGLHHHITTSTGDAVYRVDVDAYAIENLVMSGVFPLATSIIALAVMFGDPAAAERDDRAAVADRRAVPVSVPALLHDDARQPRGARQGARVEAARAALRDVLARCGWSRASRASRTSCSATPAPATTTMNARIAITWQQSLFSVVVSTITILGTALVVDRRRHAT